jgi:integrase
MALTDTAIKKLTTTGKRFRKADSDGLYLDVRPSGKKTFMYRIRLNGKDTFMSLGDYPLISLKQARQLRDENILLVQQGINPLDHKKQQQAEHQALAAVDKIQNELTFAKLFEEFSRFKTTSLSGNKPSWSYETLRKHELRLKKHVIPMLGALPVNSLTELDLERVLIAIQDHGTLANRNKVLTLFRLMFKYAKGKRYIAHNIALEVNTEDLIKHTPKPFKHVTTERDLAELVKQLDGLNSTFEVKQCLIMGLHIFSRPSEVVRLKWSQVDFEAGLVDLEITKTQTSTESKILQTPMSQQVREILQSLYEVTGETDYVFCTPYGGRNAPLSRDSLSNALRNNGVDNVNPHGFRHTASTALNNLGFDADEIEIQLSHSIKGTRGVYNSAEKLQQRTKLLQAWSNHLDGLKAGANVLHIHRNAKEYKG